MSRQWSMQAELSISNDNCDAKITPTTKESQDGNVVRMVYTFTTTPPKTILNNTRMGNSSENNNSYGFQRGNMTFTSTPPFQNRLGVQDSGYNSDHLFSSNSNSQNSGRTYMPYERRCKSTCSITLSTDFNADSNKNVRENASNPPPCDTCRPCYFVERVRCVPDNCEECKRSHSLPSRTENTYSTHFCTKVPEKPHQWSQFGTKDMMTQTVETREKCTSPLEKIQDDNKSDSELSKYRKKNVRNSSNRKKSTNVVRRYSDLGSQNKNINRSLTRSPGIIFDKFKEALKTQTVHIDVYCTASDGDSDSDATIIDSDEEMDTVFKSDAQKVTHRRANKKELPFSLQAFKNNIPPNIFNPELVRNDSYSGDDSSTAYPSALSSYSTITDCEGSLSTTYPLWCQHSVSNCTLSELNASTEDLNSKLSISDSESVYQRKFDLRSDCSFVSDKSDTSQKPELRPKDSFEYADCSDVDRIKKMEALWSSSGQKKNWKSPQCERKHKLQQQKIQEYIERKLQNKLVKEPISDSSDSSDESQNSTVITYDKERNTKANLTRGSTVSKSTSTKEGAHVEKRNGALEKNSLEQSTSSVPELLLNNSTPVISNAVPEFSTEPFWKARKFGTVIGARNLGRHVGPTKNPDCFCAHCRSYFSENANRNRARSVGCTPFTETENWRNVLKPRGRKSRVTDY